MESDTSIRLVRLVNGECILSFVEIDDDGFYIFGRPIQVVTDPEFMLDKKRQTLVMYVWLPTTLIQGDSVQIAPEHVLYTAPIAENIVESYIEFAKRLYDPNRNKVTAVEDITKEVTGQMNKDEAKDLLQEIVEGLAKNTDKDKLN